MNGSPPQESPAPRKSNPMPLLAVLLALALGVVVYSWRASKPVASHAESASTQGLDFDPVFRGLDQVTDSVQARMQRAAQSLDISRWPSKIVPVPTPTPVLKKNDLEQKPALDFHLKGVVRQGTQALAFINDRTLALGESIDGYRLAEIDAESVVLIDPEGEQTVLRLYETTR